jgi:Mitoribosomal protein mL52
MVFFAHRCANSDGPLHDVPDWSFADGTPAPEEANTKRASDARKSQKLFKKIVGIAHHANKAAEAGVMPAVPSVKRHRKRDAQFYWDHGEEDAIAKLEKEGKIPL